MGLLYVHKYVSGCVCEWVCVLHEEVHVRFKLPNKVLMHVLVDSSQL